MTRHALARNLSLQGRGGEAAEQLRLGLKARPSPLSFHFDRKAQDLVTRLELAETLFAEARSTEGLEILEETRTVHGGSVAERAWIKGLIAAGQPAEALRDGLSALQGAEPDTQVLLLLAEAAEVCGRSDLAQRWREQVGGLAHV